MLNISINATEVRIFLAILLRLSVVLFLIPVFSTRQLPTVVKALMSLVLANILYLTLGTRVAPIPSDFASILRVTLGEVAFGTIVALTFLIIFAGFQFAGELISFQMGFGIAQVVDPQSGAQVTAISQLFQLVSILIFFSIDGHHLILKALAESFTSVPVGGFTMTTHTFTRVILLSGQMFVIGLKMAAPVMIVLFLTHVGLGLMAKFAPEINILIVSFPLTILLGFVFLGLSLPTWGDAIHGYFSDLFHFLRSLMG